MNNGKILLSFRFASAMDHSAPQFSRYCPSIPLSSSSFSQVGTVSYQIISPYKFIFHPSFQVFFSHIWPRDHDSLSLERTFSSTNLSFRFSNFPLEPRGGVKNTGVLERPCLSSRERRKKNEVEKEEEGRERHTEFPRNPATALT